MTYPPYPHMKPSGIPWLGNIPQHWTYKRLKYTVSLVTTKTDKLPDSLRYLGLENIESFTGKIIWNEGSTSGEGACNLFSVGDVLFGKLRPYLAKAAIASTYGACTSELLVLRARLVDNRFLLYYMLSGGFIKTVDASTYGSKMPRASWEYIGDLPQLLPPLEEQQAIAAFLDRKTAAIDALIRDKERQIALLGEQRQALISYAVTRGIDPDAPLRPSGIAWLGDMPQHWQCLPLKRVFRVANGATPSSGKEEYWNGDIAWVTPDDLGKTNTLVIYHSVRAITQEGYDNCGTQIVPAGSLVVSTRAPIGHVKIAGMDLCTNQGCRCLVPKVTCEAKYMYYLVLTAKAELNARGNGSTFQEISKTDMEAVMILFPPIDEQQAIVAYIDRKTKRMDDITQTVQEQINKLRAYRQVLVSEAVTGKIDVRGEID